MPTRRTHIVRIHDTVSGNGGGQYVDVEVLDAVAFRTDQGKEVVFNCPASAAVPFIVDDTGDGSQKSPPSPTRRSHMERITGKDKSQFFDVEVLDAISFRDANGTEWIYNAPSKAAVPYNLTEASGGKDTTRRTHLEKVGTSGAEKNPGSYLTVERTDMMAFRTINGRELIIKMPSADDGSASRADTHMTPPDYDPKKTTSTPPNNKDPHTYVKFVKGGGLLTKDVKIAQGPLWWIRKIGTGAILFVEVSYNLVDNTENVPPQPGLTLEMPFGPGGAKDGTFDLLGNITLQLPGVTATPPIVNPVSDAMLESYFQWTPAVLYELSQKGATTGGNQIWWVGGFGTGPTGPPNGYILPSPTLENFAQELYFTPGQSFPYILTTDVPDQPNPGDFDANGTVLQLQKAPFNVYINPADHAHTAAEVAALTHVPEYISGDNSYPTAAAAGQAAAWINSLPLFGTGDNPTGVYGAGSVATVEGPLNLGGGGPGRSARIGSAVFAINYAQLQGAWAAKSPSAPVTFSIKVTLPGVTSQFISVTAEGYTKKRDFPLDAQNNPTFTPWDTDHGVTLQAEGTIIGTIAPDPADPTLLKVTFTTA